MLDIYSANLQPFDSRVLDAFRIEGHLGQCSIPPSAIAGQSNRDVPVPASSHVGTPSDFENPGLLSTPDLAANFPSSLVE